MLCSVILCAFIVCLQVTNLVVAARVVETITELDEDEEACVTKLNLDANEIKILNSRKFPPEDNADFNEFLGCCWKKAGLQAMSGEVDYDGLKDILKLLLAKDIAEESLVVKLLAEHIVTESVDDCREEYPTGKSFGQMVVKVQNCVRRNLSQL